MKNMKKLLVLVLLTFTVLSCNKSDDTDIDSGDDLATLIVGTWRFVSSSTNGVLDGNNDPCTTQTTIKFVAPSNITFSERYGTNCESITEDSGTYSLSGRNLMVTMNQESTTVEITTLNTTDFVVSYTDEGNAIVENYSKQ